jgi:hypothetical protein
MCSITSNVGVNWYFGLLIVGAGEVAKIAGASDLAESREIDVMLFKFITFILYCNLMK